MQKSTWAHGSVLRSSIGYRIETDGRNASPNFKYLLNDFKQFMALKKAVSKNYFGTNDKAIVIVKGFFET